MIGLLKTILMLYLNPIINIVSEFRRLFIDPQRIESLKDNDYCLLLGSVEIHYISRVLRLKKGDFIDIVNGNGDLYRAKVLSFEKLYLTRILNKYPKDHSPNPKICLACVLPKKGFEDVLRMGCEIGVDIFQPLFSDRCQITKVSEKRFARWDHILNESVEQCERLWKPKLNSIASFENWVYS